jgi:predicted amidohydrolase
MTIPAEQAFAVLYRQLHAEIVLNGVDQWRADPDVSVAIDQIAQRVRATGHVELPDAGHDAAAQFEMFVTMRAIDRAFAAINPIHGVGGTPAGLSDARQRHSIDGRYNGDTGDGVVIPRLATPSRDTEEPDRIDLLFGSLLFVPSHLADRVRHVVVPAGLRVPPDLRAAGFAVACAAFLEEATELSWSYPTRGGLRYYRIELRDLQDVRNRAKALAPKLAAAHAHLALLPELANATWLHEVWRQLLAEEVGAGAVLQWGVMGTGNLKGPDHPGEPVNETRLMDAATGEDIFAQRKGHRFDVDPYMLKVNYPLLDAPHGELLREDIRVGSPPTVAEMGAVRLAILICEDLGRLEMLLSIISAFGVSHVLAPVFSKPTEEGGWEQVSGGAYTAGGGTTVVVANSLVLGRLAGKTDELGVSLAAGPIHPPAYAKSTAPDSVTTYVLRDDEGPELR